MFKQASRHLRLLVLISLFLSSTLYALDFSKIEFQYTQIPANNSKSESFNLNLGQIFIHDLVGDSSPEFIFANHYSRIQTLHICGIQKNNGRPVFQYLQTIKLFDQYGPKQYKFLDFVRLGQGKKQIVTANQQGIFTYPLEENQIITTPVKILDITFPDSIAKGYSFRDISIDIDRDGIDELLIPDFEKPVLYKINNKEWVSIPLPGTTGVSNSLYLSNPNLGSNDFPPGSMFYSEITKTPGFYFEDINGDSRLDLINITSDFENRPGITREKVNRYYKVHYFQNGEFNQEPDVQFTGEVKPYSNTRFQDFNGDQFPDKVEYWATGDPVSPKSWLKLYLANPKSKPNYPPRPQYYYRSKDPIGFNFFNDVNQDGQLDIFAFEFDYSISSSGDMAGIILGREFDLDLKGYLSTSSGWPRRPDIRHPLKLRGTQLNFHLDLYNDFNGDGISDLAVQDRSEALSVYLYDAKRTAFSKRPDARLNCEDFSSVYIGDLNNDKKADLIYHHLKKEKLIAYISK